MVIRIAVLNNYSLTRVTQEVALNLKPAHHLFGIDVLGRNGYETICIDPDESRVWYKIGSLLGRIPFCNVGDLGIQFEALRQRKSYDLVYAPCQTVTIFLGVLSYFGLFNKKIIAVAHHPFLKGRFGRLRKYSLYFALRGHASYSALGGRVADEINAIARCKLSKVLHWGPELPYYDRIRRVVETRDTQNKTDILAIGRTGRDYNTLIRAFVGSSCRLDIYTTREFRPEIEPTPNIVIHYLDDPEQLKYPDIIKLTSHAKILAIPMFSGKNLSGLTSVTDALALAVPMMITRNEYIEADVERAGAGFWIDLSDAKGWRNKAEALLNDAATLAVMGQNARNLAEKKFNSDVFGIELLEIIRNFPASRAA
jgi:glycosyltransferase involved in cell wall biosynthesis